MPRITSTSFITGTGFMKCMPITLSGLRVAAASLVMEIEEVLDASIVSALVNSSSVLKILVFTFRSSVTASMMIDASRKASSVSGTPDATNNGVPFSLTEPLFIYVAL